MTVKLVEITEAAYHHIQSLIKEKDDNLIFRVSIKKTGCSGYMYRPELVNSPKKDDLLIETALGLTILVDASCAPIMKGTVIDYVKKDLGQYQLRFNNPNAVGACGCGESFHLKEGK